MTKCGQWLAFFFLREVARGGSWWLLIFSSEPIQSEAEQNPAILTCTNPPGPFSVGISLAANRAWSHRTSKS